MTELNCLYREFCESLPDTFIIFLEVCNKIKENEISITNSFQWDPKKHQFVLFKKSQLEPFFAHFVNVPRQVNWSDSKTVISGNGPYTIQTSGFFYIVKPSNGEEFIVNFQLVATVKQRGVFG